MFAHDKLTFISHGIIGELIQNRSVTLPLDSTVGFDVNAAQYLCRLVEGRTDPPILRFKESLRSLAHRRFNWELMPFLLERSEAIYEGRDLDFIWRVALASEFLGACDHAEFASTGNLHPRLNQDEMAAGAQRSLADWHRLLREGEMNRLTSWRSRTGTPVDCA